jgi:hypothetical protein
LDGGGAARGRPDSRNDLGSPHRDQLTMSGALRDDQPRMARRCRSRRTLPWASSTEAPPARAGPADRCVPRRTLEPRYRWRGLAGPPI